MSLRIDLKGYFPQIDGIRAIAIIAVIANHFNKELLPGGYLGVDIFFVVSGYVITSSLAKRQTENLLDFLLEFYSRRVKRIIPALVFCLAISGFLINFVNYLDPNESLKAGRTALLGFSNIYFYNEKINYFSSSNELNIFLQTWSLGVEEQFHFIYPALYWFSGFCRTEKLDLKIFFPLLLLLSIISYRFFISLDPIKAYFLMPARFWELGAGCLLFLCQSKINFLSFKNKLFNTLTKILAYSIIILILICLSTFHEYQYFANTSIVILTIILIVFATESEILRKFLANSTIINIGKYSYSLYLWHWPVICISRWTIGIELWTIPIQILIIIGLSVFSYNYIENPMRKVDWSIVKFKTVFIGFIFIYIGLWTIGIDLLTFSIKRLLQVTELSILFYIFLFKKIDKVRFILFKLKTILYGFILIFIVFSIFNYLNNNSLYLGVKNNYSSPDNQYGYCNLLSDYNKSKPISYFFGPGKCGNFVSKKNKTIYVFGDSHGGQFIGAVNQYAKDHNLNSVGIWKAGRAFPFDDGSIYPFAPDSSKQSNLASQNQVKNVLLQNVKSGDIVIIGNSTYQNFSNDPENPMRTGNKNINKKLEAEINYKREFYFKTLQDLTITLSKKGVNTILTLDTPIFRKTKDFNDLRDTACDKQWFNSSDLYEKECIVSSQKFLHYREPIAFWTKKIQSQSGLIIWDLYDKNVCNSGYCIANTYLYNDAEHLKSDYTKYLLNIFISKHKDVF